MEKVLLAIDGISPSKQILHYAVQLSRRIRAQLNVLEIISPKRSKEYIHRVRRVANHTKRYLERSLVAATFAEAGEHEMAQELMAEALENLNQLLPESEKEGIAYQLTLKPGHLAEEILKYVNTHRDVVLAIYDGTQGKDITAPVSTKDTPVPREIIQNLSIPLVVIRGT
jgi:nucleotide-binding universal stress UspA family protein